MKTIGKPDGIRNFSGCVADNINKTNITVCGIAGRHSRGSIFLRGSPRLPNPAHLQHFVSHVLLKPGVTLVVQLGLTWGLGLDDWYLDLDHGLCGWYLGLGLGRNESLGRKFVCVRLGWHWDKGHHSDGWWRHFGFESLLNNDVNTKLREVSCS